MNWTNDFGRMQLNKTAQKRTKSRHMKDGYVQNSTVETGD